MTISDLMQPSPLFHTQPVNVVKSQAYTSYGLQQSYQPYAPHHTVVVPPAKVHKKQHHDHHDERKPLLKSKKKTKKAKRMTDASDRLSLDEQNVYLGKVYGILAGMLMFAGCTSYCFKWSPAACEFFDSYIGECIEVTCAVLAILLHLTIKLGTSVLKCLGKKRSRLYLVCLCFMFAFEIVITGGLVCELSNEEVPTHLWAPRAVILTHTLTSLSALILCLQTFQHKVRATDPLNMVLPVCFNLLFVLVFSFVGPLPLYTVLVGGLVSLGLSCYLVLDAKRVLDKEGAAFYGSVPAGVLELFLDFTAIVSAAASLSILLLCKFKVLNKFVVGKAKDEVKEAKDHKGCC
ncbi:MAG: hypothetical protein KVP17_001359 [Porospora cf. gigantea B]|uniref:uncharacterized protein n=2 Tax=Porospora cf. gigantea B TaxID=2853592 RepID=UPI003571A1D4|nr:MAG: hypothetical protein KVP17_001359 [Porospora cf. gigantea B]